MSDDGLYKREDDKKWRTKVDHEQITLMTGHQVIRDKIDEITDRLRAIDKDREFLLRQHDLHDDKLTKLYAVIFQDPTGQKGLLHDVDILMGRKRLVSHSSDRRWQFFTAIAVALVSLIGLLVTNVDKVERFYDKTIAPRFEKQKPKPVKRRPKPRITKPPVDPLLETPLN